jgi:DNA-binding PadR family transcriptional regulator
VTLREPTFLILTSLASGPRHGYGIIQDIADLSDGRVAGDHRELPRPDH